MPAELKRSILLFSMISKVAYRGTRTPAVSRVISSSCVQRSHIHTTATSNKGVKETLNDVNKRVGKAAAEGIEKTEHATHHLGENIHDMEEKVKHALHEANIKTGQKAAKGIEEIEKITKKLHH